MLICHVPEKIIVHNRPRFAYFCIISSSLASFKIFQSFWTNSMSFFIYNRGIFVRQKIMNNNEHDAYLHNNLIYSYNK